MLNNIILKVKNFYRNASYTVVTKGTQEFVAFEKWQELEARFHAALAVYVGIIEGGAEHIRQMCIKHIDECVKAFKYIFEKYTYLCHNKNIRSTWHKQNVWLLNKIYRGHATLEDYLNLNSHVQAKLSEATPYVAYEKHSGEFNCYGEEFTQDLGFNKMFGDNKLTSELIGLCFGSKGREIRELCFEWISNKIFHNEYRDYDKYRDGTYELNITSPFVTKEQKTRIEKFYSFFKDQYMAWASKQNFIGYQADEVGVASSMPSEQIAVMKTMQGNKLEVDPINEELDRLATEEIIVKDNRRSVESGNNAEKLGFRLFRLFVVKQRVVNIFTKIFNKVKTSLKFDKENAMFSYLANFNPDLYFQIRECETLLEVIKRQGLSLVSLSFSDAIEAVDRVYNDGSDCTQELRNVREMLELTRKSTNLLKRVKGAFAQAKRAAASFNVNAQTLEALQMHTNVTRAQNGYCPSLYQALYQEDLDRYSDQALEKLEYIVKDTKAYNDLYDRIAAAKDTGKDSIHFVMDKVTPVVGSEVASKIFDLYKSLVEDAGVNYEDPWNLFDGNEIADGLLPAEALKAINYIFLKADEDYEDYIFSSQFATDAEIEAAFQAELAAANEQIKSENARRAHLRAVQKLVLMDLDNIIQSIPNPNDYVAAAYYDELASEVDDIDWDHYTGRGKITAEESPF